MMVREKSQIDSFTLGLVAEYLKFSKSEFFRGMSPTRIKLTELLISLAKKNLRHLQRILKIIGVRYILKIQTTSLSMWN